MLFLMTVRIPTEPGNAALRDPAFGAKMHKLLKKIKAEAAYFTTIDGNRGAHIYLKMDDASQIPAIAEPFFLWLHADVTFSPVMRLADLAKGEPGIKSAVKNWG
jgi:hypothetical protein